MAKESIIPSIKNSKFTGAALEAIKSILADNGYGTVQDTGWRDITSLITAPEFETLKTQPGLLCARRVGTRCTLRYSPLFAGGPGLGTAKAGATYILMKKLPGFSPCFPKIDLAGKRFMWGTTATLSARGTVNVGRWMGWGVDSGDARFTGLLIAPDLGGSISLEYDTVDPFPIELPGTPIEFATPDHLK
jgi:hypothetical protein